MKQARGVREGSGLLFTVVLGYAGCTVDQRALELSSQAGFWIIGGAPDAGAGSGGKPTSPAESAGMSSSSMHVGGASGAPEGGVGTDSGGAVTALIDGCPDLDQNGVGDCDETIVHNGSFKTDVTGWSGEGEAQIEWSPLSPYADAPSGSGVVIVQGFIDSDGQALRAASQCVKLDGSGQVAAYASVFVQGKQGEGSASLGAFFFATADCTAAPLGSPLEAPASGVDAWQVVATRQSIPEGAASMLVRLGVTKPYRSAAFRALFDNILVRLE